MARLKREPLQWHLVLTIGELADPTNDATVEWPGDRTKIDAGTLTIDHIESEETSPGMLSAARYPVIMYGTVHLPWILPRSMRLYTVLREGHTLLAYLLFFTFMAHLSAVLFHTLVLGDGLLLRMAPWRRGPRTVPEASPGRSTTRPGSPSLAPARRPSHG